MRTMKPRQGTETRIEKLSRSVRRTQIAIGLAYLYDAAILFGFYFAGFVKIHVPVSFVGACVLVFAAVGWAHRSGWSRRLNDPTLFLPQQFFAITIALAMAIMAPQIGFQPFATLLAISAFSFMAPNTRSLIACWSAGAAASVAVIFYLGPRLSMPTSTLAGQALTGTVVIGLLARCIWIATFFRGLRLRLKEKNSELNALIERIEFISNRDELTGLANRRSVTCWLDEQIAAVGRTGAPLSIALLDLDHFKKINDSFGHPIGDRALQEFSRIAAAALRRTDRVGRYGGEEFLVVLVGTPLHEATVPLERVRNKLAAHDWNEVKTDLRLTITIGAAQYIPGESVERLIGRADMALYLGKEGGRDRVVLDETIIPNVAADAVMSAA